MFHLFSVKKNDRKKATVISRLKGTTPSSRQHIARQMLFGVRHADAPDKRSILASYPIYGPAQKEQEEEIDVCPLQSIRVVLYIAME